MSRTIKVTVPLIGSMVSILAAFTKRRSMSPTGKPSSMAVLMLTRLVNRLTTLALVPNMPDMPCPEVFTVCKTLTLPACLSMETQATTLTTTDEIINDIVMKVTSIQATMPTTAAIEPTTRLMQLAQATPLPLPVASPHLLTVLPTEPPLLKSLMQTPTESGVLWSIMLKLARPLPQELADMHRPQTVISAVLLVAVTQVLNRLVSRRLSTRVTVVVRRELFLDVFVVVTTPRVTRVPSSILRDVIQL